MITTILICLFTCYASYTIVDYKLHKNQLVTEQTNDELKKEAIRLDEKEKKLDKRIDELYLILYDFVKTKKN